MSADCIGCDRPMRHQRASAKDFPGTVAHAARGRCTSCYESIRPNRGIAGRPTNDPIAELIRFVPGAGHQLVRGKVVTVSMKRYVLLLPNGHKGEFDRDQWFEVIAE